jgi:hypothetical protein
MASPILNEDLIAAMLSTASTAEHGLDLRTAAFFMLLDAYDRKVERDAYFKIALAAVQFCEMMGRLESVTGLHASFKANTLNIDTLDEALVRLTSVAETHRKNLGADMQLLMQCPGDNDTKN